MTFYLILLSSLPLIPIIMQSLIILYQIIDHNCEYHGHKK